MLLPVCASVPATPIFRQSYFGSNVTHEHAVHVYIVFAVIPTNRYYSRLPPADSTNRDCLDTIERCIFVLCLDNAVQDGADSGASQWRDDESLALQMVHGSGVVHNTCNRWFDKTMQVSTRVRHGSSVVFM